MADGSKDEDRNRRARVFMLVLGSWRRGESPSGQHNLLRLEWSSNRSTERLAGDHGEELDRGPGDGQGMR
jgi:hypothetical protein